MKNRFLLLALVGGLLAGAVPGHAQPAASTPPEKSSRPASPPPPPAAAKSDTKSDAAPKPADKGTPEKKPDAPAPAASPQQLKEDFDKQSKDVLAKYNALVARLRAAQTTEERNKIIAELREENNNRLAQQRERAREIKEQKLRDRSEVGAAVRPGP